MDIASTQRSLERLVRPQDILRFAQAGSYKPRTGNFEGTRTLPLLQLPLAHRQSSKNIVNASPTYTMSRRGMRNHHPNIPLPSCTSLNSSPSSPPLQVHFPHAHHPFPMVDQRSSMPVIVSPVSALVPSSPYHDASFASEPPMIDHLLAAPPDTRDPPPLVWDIVDHPNAIMLPSVGGPHVRQLCRDDLARPAVRRRGGRHELDRITLIFRGLPLVVDIEPDDRPLWTSRPLPYVTVGDVLYQLYRAMRLSVDEREFDGLRRSMQDLMYRAFELRRERDSPTGWDKNTRHGVRNVDRLGDMRGLVGLRPAVGGEVPYGMTRGETFVVLLAPVHETAMLGPCSWSGDDSRHRAWYDSRMIDRVV